MVKSNDTVYIMTKTSTKTLGYTVDEHERLIGIQCDVQLESDKRRLESYGLNPKHEVIGIYDRSCYGGWAKDTHIQFNDVNYVVRFVDTFEQKFGASNHVYILAERV